MLRFPFIFCFTKTCSSLWRLGLSACRPGASVSLHAWRPETRDGRRCRLALLCLLVCECSEVLILCLPSDFYRVGATARDTLSVWNLTPVATSQDMLLISKKKNSSAACLSPLRVFSACWNPLHCSNYEKLPFNLNPGRLFKYSPLFSISF